MVRVLLADDNALIRRCIRRLLAANGDLEVIGEAAGFSEGLATAQQTKPDVIVLDIHMPLELPAEILGAQFKSCGAKVLGTSFANDDEAKSLAKNMGAADLLDKTALATELIPAIIRVARANNDFRPTVSAPRRVGSQL